MRDLIRIGWKSDTESKRDVKMGSPSRELRNPRTYRVRSLGVPGNRAKLRKFLQLGLGLKFGLVSWFRI